MKGRGRRSGGVDMYWKKRPDMCYIVSESEVITCES